VLRSLRGQAKESVVAPENERSFNFFLAILYIILFSVTRLPSGGGGQCGIHIPTIYLPRPQLEVESCANVLQADVASLPYIYITIYTAIRPYI